jgi:hypothetical protein
MSGNRPSRHLRGLEHELHGNERRSSRNPSERLSIVRLLSPESVARIGNVVRYPHDVEPYDHPALVVVRSQRLDRILHQRRNYGNAAGFLDGLLERSRIDARSAREPLPVNVCGVRALITGSRLVVRLIVEDVSSEPMTVRVSS